MITNGEIRRQVTEQIKPHRLKIFAYQFLYGMIAGAMGGCVGGILGFISSFIGGLIGIVICMILKIEDYQAISNVFISPFYYTAMVALSIFMAVFAVGLVREILQLNSDNNVSPVAFFSLGFKDYKRTLKTNLRYWLKLLPAIILYLLGDVFFAIATITVNAEILPIILAATGFLLYLVGGSLLIIYSLLYQALPYVLAKDEITQDPKQVLAKSRELLRGHFWQWTRMNFFYSFISFLIVFALVLVSVMGIALGVVITQNAGDGAVLFGVLLVVIMIILICVVAIASSFLMTYFSAKNVFNLNELYNAIEAEKSQTVA